MKTAQTLCPYKYPSFSRRDANLNLPSAKLNDSPFHKDDVEENAPSPQVSVAAPPVKINQNPQSIWADHIFDQEYTPAPPDFLELLTHSDNLEKLKQTLLPDYMVVYHRVASLLPEIPPPPKSSQTLKDSSIPVSKRSLDPSEPLATTHPEEPKETFVSMFKSEEELLVEYRRDNVLGAPRPWSEKRQMAIEWAYRWVLWEHGPRYERRLRYEQRKKLGYFKSRPKNGNGEKHEKHEKCTERVL